MSQHHLHHQQDMNSSPCGIFEENDLKEHFLTNTGSPSEAHLKKSLRPRSKHTEQVKIGGFSLLKNGF